jgi:2-polyprenyl-6-methoxyphenol hydroxylase-like FAD-dependent oxidoreductase
MATILVLGGGICGLGTAALLARDGHDVVVLERDRDPPPGSSRDAWSAWSRKGIAQFRQPHNLMPGLRLLLEAELPELQAELVKAGAARLDLLDPMPPQIADRSPRAVDGKLWTYTARRPAAEHAFATIAAAEPRVRIRRGVRIESLIGGPRIDPAVPHVTGVRTTDGQTLSADLVVDATGRGSRAPAWIVAIGGRTPLEEKSECAFVYRTRYFSGRLPKRLAPVLTPIGTIALLTLPGDNDTWSVTIQALTNDAALKGLSDAQTWTNVIAACPLHAHWLDGEPIDNVMSMSGVLDRYRRFVVDGRPVVTGFVAVADAWACTNPSAGRGVTVGMMHALALRNALREQHDDDWSTFAMRFDAVTETDITPWYRAQIATDRARVAQIDAVRAGRTPEPIADPLARRVTTLLGATRADADLFRAAMEYVGTVTPIQDILRRPEVADAIDRATSVEPLPVPGPSRTALLELLRAR